MPRVQLAGQVVLPMAVAEGLGALGGDFGVLDRSQRWWHRRRRRQGRRQRGGRRRWSLRAATGVAVVWEGPGPAAGSRGGSGNAAGTGNTGGSSNAGGSSAGGSSSVGGSSNGGSSGNAGGGAGRGGMGGAAAAPNIGQGSAFPNGIGTGWNWATGVGGTRRRALRAMRHSGDRPHHVRSRQSGGRRGRFCKPGRGRLLLLVRDRRAGAHAFLCVRSARRRRLFARRNQARRRG